MNARVKERPPLRLVSTLLAEHRPDEAERVLRRASVGDRREPEVVAVLASLLAAQGRLAEAADQATRALAAGPLPAPLVVSLAGTLAQARHHDAADRALATAIDGGDPAVELRVGRARLAERCGRTDLALRHWQRALALVPDHPETRLGIARSLRAEGHYVEAEAACRQLQAAAPGDPRPLAELARIAQDAGDPVEAESRWHAALLAHPDHGSAQLGLAWALATQHHFADARALLSALGSAMPPRTEPLTALVRTAMLEGDHATARLHARRLLDLEPRHLPHALRLGRVLEAAGELHEAAELYRRLATEHPQAPEPRFATAGLAGHRGDLVAARAEFEALLDDHPQHVEAWLGLADTLAELGLGAAAETAAAAGVALAPNQPRTQRCRAGVAESLGRLEAARLALLEARSLMPHRQEPLLELARLALRHGILDAAAEHAAALLTAHPRSLAARLAACDVAFARQELDAARSLLAALAGELGQHRDVQHRLARLDWHDGAVTRARRRVARASAFDPRLHGPADTITRLDPHPLPPPAGEVRAFLLVRNERVRLPWLLDHYRRLGVHRFLVLDNDSDDGTGEWLLQQEPDVHVFHTTASFAGAGAGMRWTNGLLDEHGTGAWCLTVDADEVLVYPHCERVDLPGLTAYLEATGAEALLAPMLDMYADGPVDEAHYEPGCSLIETFPYFDSSGYVWRDAGKFPYVKVQGGCRARAFYATPSAGPILQKVPLIRWAPDIKYTSSKHTAFPCRLADLSGALLHFKYLPAFAAHVQAEVARGQHYMGATEYRTYLRRLDAGSPLTLMGPSSARYRDSDQLVELGLMRSSARFDAHARG